MWPFTITTLGSLPDKVYTLCTPTEQARSEWVGKLQESMTMRQIDMESNRVRMIMTCTAVPLDGER